MKIANDCVNKLIMFIRKQLFQLSSRQHHHSKQALAFRVFSFCRHSRDMLSPCFFFHAQSFAQCLWQLYFSLFLMKKTFHLTEISRHRFFFPFSWHRRVLLFSRQKSSCQIYFLSSSVLSMKYYFRRKVSENRITCEWERKKEEIMKTPQVT